MLKKRREKLSQSLRGDVIQVFGIHVLKKVKNGKEKDKGEKEELKNGCEILLKWVNRRYGLWYWDRTMIILAEHSVVLVFLR